MIEGYIERYGHSFVELVDSSTTGKSFAFDQTLLMPTAEGYRALVEQARAEISPRIMRYLSRRWSQSTIENLSFFVMAVAVYARSIMDPPVHIDVGRVLLRTAAACNRRCIHGRGGCALAMGRERHHLPKCIKVPREVSVLWGYVKRYIATGGAVCPPSAAGLEEAMGIRVSPGSDFYPAASC
ncbi:MAG: hypothetical protein QUS08_08805 [Methanothrix sp.]|nr:hypothetical protein [Methanothrix sp.]